MTKLDLKDAFFMIPKAPQSRHVLLFKLNAVIPVQVPPIWAVHIPQSLHEDPQTSHKAPERSGDTYGDLHGRHATHGKLKAVNSGAHTYHHLCAGEPKLHYQQQKIIVGPVPGN